MNSGLLWFDNSKRPFAEKLSAAAKRYTDKFGIAPDTCIVNPADVPAGGSAVAGIEIRAKQTVMPNHLWLGVSKPVEVTQ